ncbi:hypothetical protein [Novosphingobium sp.]|uniref:hypothetical protein n=1 Tax=Novosphingobium sp. TaxID=1874826 RepID=UPI0027340472|nr:hypothetical protein [Novosphingobium sp.]MDP3907602.1 hypothetical protein [Novosphingobium sp.]
MGLFKLDLYRSFAIGFVLGAIGLFGAIGLQDGTSLAHQMIPAAEAAPAHPDRTR